MDNMVFFKSIGSFYDVVKGTLHPAFNNGVPDLDENMAVHILDCDFYEVSDNLNEDDRDIFMAYFHNQKENFQATC